MKDMPKVGDTVRVVLEFTAWGIMGNEIGFKGGRGWIDLEGDYVKSIEIIAPPKPSVRDLPAWAVVQDKTSRHLYQRMAASDTWAGLTAPHDGNYATREVDHLDWVQLVEKVDE